MRKSEQALAEQGQYKVRFNFARDAKAFEETVADKADAQVKRDDMTVLVMVGEQLPEEEFQALIELAKEFDGTSINLTLLRKLITPAGE